MNAALETETKAAAALHETKGAAPVNPSSEDPSKNTNVRPFVPPKGKDEASLKERAGILLGGVAIFLAILMLALGRLQHASTTVNKSPSSQKNAITQPARSPESTVPITDEGRGDGQTQEQLSKLGPEEIARTAKHTEPVAANLGGIPPFDSQGLWQPAPYQANTPLAEATNGESDVSENKDEKAALEKPSLVFVKNPQTSTVTKSPENSLADFGIGLSPGTRLRARIESAVNTALQTPVVAVIEYNYEKNGEIVVPAGSRAFGHLETADRSGYVAVRFDSMQLPDGTSIAVEATATDLQLRPLKGKVEGKHAGKSILVRSFTGLGEVTAMIAGRGSLNQPLSEGDLLRERAASNVAQASDEQIARLAITERIVVTVPANMDIYVVLGKPASIAEQHDLRTQPARPLSTSSTEQLRQLLQLQQELSQQAEVSGSKQ